MKHLSIYKESNSYIKVAILALSLLMFTIALYLIKEHFDLRYPTGFSENSLNLIEKFINCQVTNLTIYGVPLISLGLFAPLLVLHGFIIMSSEYERSIYLSLILNFFIASLLITNSGLIQNSFCPLYLLYWIANFIILILFYKNSSLTPFSKKHTFYLFVGVLVFSALDFTVINKTIKNHELANREVLNQFFKLPPKNALNIESEFKVYSQKNAPIKIAVFSDFECYGCKLFSNQLKKIGEKYKNKIDVQYYFFPFDQNCNPRMHSTIHQFACKAAFVASCLPSSTFSKTHSEIFDNQEKFSLGFLDQFIKSNQLESCVSSPRTKNKILEHVMASEPINITTTPTYLINGVKIEGVIPLEHLYAILDELLIRSKNH